METVTGNEINIEVRNYLKCLPMRMPFGDKLKSAVAQMNDIYDMNPTDEANFRAIILDELEALENWSLT